MSVINLMLQELDERRTQPTAAALPAGLAPVGRSSVAATARWRRRLPVALASVTVLMSAAAGAHYWQRHDTTSAGAPDALPIRAASPTPVQLQTSSASMPLHSSSVSGRVAPTPHAPDRASGTAAPARPNPAVSPPTSPSSLTRSPAPADDVALTDSLPSNDRTAPASRLRLFEAAPQAHSVSERRLPAPAGSSAVASQAPAASMIAPTNAPATVAPAGGTVIARTGDTADNTAGGTNTTSPVNTASTASTAGPVSIERHSRAPTLVSRAESAYRTAITRYNAGDLTAAVQGLRAVIAEDGSHAAARQALAAMLIDRREWDAALQVLEDGLRSDPRNAQFAQLAAQISIRRDDLQGALRILNAAIHDRSPPELDAMIAGVLVKLKRERESIAHWSRALRQTPQKADWWLALAIALEGDARPAEARSAYERAVGIGGLRTAAVDYARERIAALN